MLGYDASKKLYLVKRVQMVNLLPEWEKKKVARLNKLQGGSKTKLKQRTKSPQLHSPSEDAKQELKKSKSEGQRRSSRAASAKKKVAHMNLDRTEDMEEGTYWVPRVRLMFAAEDPRVFADRVAYAHKTR